MNDSDMEKWLAERFRAAPHPEPSERLQQAVDADRIGASVSRGSIGPSRALGLFGRRPLLAGLVGLAATAVLAAGLLAVVANRPTQTPAAPGGAIEWQPSTQVSGFTFALGPYLASAGGRLYLVGSIAVMGGSSATEVWSSADGARWQRVAESGAFDKSGSGVAAAGISDDGNGGLVVVGSIGSTAPMAWHSPDGRTWTQADVGAAGSGELKRVAARPGAIVAFGDWMAPVSVGGTANGQRANQLGVWFSANGNTWGQVVLPDSVGYTPSALTAWKGGFAAVAQKGTGALVSSIWTSTDGRTWEKTSSDLVGFGATAMAALGDRVVAVGSRLDQSVKLGLFPASWSSADGRTWTESSVFTRDPAVMFDDVTAVGGTLVAIGSSHMISPESAGDMTTPPPTPSESVWTSTDGTAWRLLAEVTSPKFGFYLNTHITSLGGRVVVATQSAGAVEVFLGDLVP